MYAMTLRERARWPSESKYFVSADALVAMVSAGLAPKLRPMFDAIFSAACTTEHTTRNAVAAVLTFGCGVAVYLPAVKPPITSRRAARCFSREPDGSRSRAFFKAILSRFEQGNCLPADCRSRAGFVAHGHAPKAPGLTPLLEGFEPLTASPSPNRTGLL